VGRREQKRQKYFTEHVQETETNSLHDSRRAERTGQGITLSKDRNS